jgi:hypothetical protein
VDRTTAYAGEQGRTAEASPAAGAPDAVFGYAEMARAMLWAVETTRVMLELNRTLLDLGQDMFRRQQDAAIEAMLRALGGSAAPDRTPAESGFADLARLSLEAFDRMAAAMRAANDAALKAAAREPDTERKTAWR